MTIPELQYLRESEDKVEFKEAKNNLFVTNKNFYICTHKKERRSLDNADVV